MKMYLPFGDWSKDGHGHYVKVLIEAPDMNYLRQAQIKICDRYGNDFWERFCNDYDGSTITAKIEQALIDADYPVKRFAAKQGDSTYLEFNTLAELFDSKYWQDEVGYSVSLNTCIDIFIWLLNWQGARITIYDNIPQIDSWSCYGFKTVGYGCFDD